MNILIILILTLINGIFAMSEMALSTSRKARLQNAVENGEHGAQAALDLMENPTHFLSTVQIGINLITMLNGIFGEAAFSSDVESWLLELGFGAKTASIMAIVLVVTIISYISIVFGELVPKRIGLLFPETISRWVAPPMQWLARIAKPFVVLLSASTQAVMKLIRLDKTAKQVMTEEEITAHLSEGLDAGVLEQHEHQMVHNVFIWQIGQLAP